MVGGICGPEFLDIGPASYISGYFAVAVLQHHFEKQKCHLTQCQDCEQYKRILGVKTLFKVIH